MPRFHHTNAEALDLTRKYDQTFFKKPLGLWYDLDCSWAEWCEHNDYASHKNHFILDIDFQDVLVIDTAEKMVQFHNQFCYVPEELKTVSGDWRRIDWAKLAKYYKGIEIAPYRKEQSGLGGYFWYSGFEVACGCIWDLSAIEGSLKVEHLTKFDL